MCIYWRPRQAPTRLYTVIPSNKISPEAANKQNPRQHSNLLFHHHHQSSALGESTTGKGQQHPRVSVIPRLCQANRTHQYPSSDLGLHSTVQLRKAISLVYFHEHREQTFARALCRTRLRHDVSSLGRECSHGGNCTAQGPQNEGLRCCEQAVGPRRTPG